MRRKSRILLCFAVLWVLGIAYYFYSGTTLNRKVRLSSTVCCNREFIEAGEREYCGMSKTKRAIGVEISFQQGSRWKNNDGCLTTFWCIAKWWFSRNLIWNATNPFGGTRLPVLSWYSGTRFGTFNLIVVPTWRQISLSSEAHKCLFLNHIMGIGLGIYLDVSSTCVWRQWLHAVCARRLHFYKPFRMGRK